MGLREHVLDLHAGVLVPVGHAVLLHGGKMLLGEQLLRVALPDDFHDLERHFGFQALVHQIGHDAVPCPDNV